jgi:hypothetical protein
MAGNTLGDLLKAGQLDLLKQVSADSKSAVKKPVADTGKNKTTTSQTPTAVKSSVAEDYKIFHSYVRAVVQKSELYDTMFDYGDEESFATISELYDNPVCKDIIDYFACRFFDGEFDYLDSIATDCEQGNDKTPDEYAVVLGHKVPITYQEEYDLLSLLCSTAVSLDGRFDDEPVEETVIVYKRPLSSDKKVEETQRALPYQYPKVQPGAKQNQAKSTKKDKPAKPVVAPLEKPKQDVVVKRKLSLEEQHEQKTLELRNHLEHAYPQLGITDIVADLYSKEKYGSIFTLFKTLQKEYYAKQSSLDVSTFRIYWENAHHYVNVFIRGKRRVSTGSVVGYRKRSFKSHVATSGVWSRMALYGGTNGRIIRINAGHGRR